MAHTAEIIAVGTEILLGNIANTDAQFLSRELRHSPVSKAGPAPFPCRQTAPGGPLRRA